MHEPGLDLAGFRQVAHHSNFRETCRVPASPRCAAKVPDKSGRARSTRRAWPYHWSRLIHVWTPTPSAKSNTTLSVSVVRPMAGRMRIRWETLGLVPHCLISHVGDFLT